MAEVEDVRAPGQRVALYAGRLEWDRCAYVKDPRTGKDVARPNPPEQWEIIPVPENVSEVPRAETAVLGVVTLRDRLLPLESARLAAQALPDARLIVLPGTGHSPNWERPEAVVTAIMDLSSRRARALPDRGCD